MTTSALDGLLSRVPDPDLRAAISAEVSRLRETKEFGLVFEQHFPENVRLRSYPVKRGVRVQRRDLVQGDETWVVSGVVGINATLVDADGKESTMNTKELVVVREFGEAIYPGIRQLGQIHQGELRRANIVIKGENSHALQTLLYLYEGQVDCIYIDPPFNSGARDWKYNNNYVAKDDAYRHSKWLSFMDKRLRLAKRLLNPLDAVLIVAIDENEVHHLSMLLEQIFPASKIQTVSVLINPAGASIIDQFSRVDEQLCFVHVGKALASEASVAPALEAAAKGLVDTWRNQFNGAIGNLPDARRAQFYTIWQQGKAAEKVALIMPTQITSAQSTVHYEKHLYAHRRKYPTKQPTGWESDVLVEELGKASLVGWYRNPIGGTAALAVPYTQSGVSRTMYPDFVFFHEIEGEIVIDIVDPHRPDHSDTGPKWAALAQYATTHSKVFRRVVAVIKNASGSLMSLDLRNTAVGAKMKDATSESDVRKLFDAYGAAPVRRAAKLLAYFLQVLWSEPLGYLNPAEYEAQFDRLAVTPAIPATLN